MSGASNALCLALKIARRSVSPASKTLEMPWHITTSTASFPLSIFLSSLLFSQASHLSISPYRLVSFAFTEIGSLPSSFISPQQLYTPPTPPPTTSHISPFFVSTPEPPFPSPSSSTYFPHRSLQSFSTPLHAQVGCQLPTSLCPSNSLDSESDSDHAMWMVMIVRTGGWKVVVVLGLRSLRGR